MRLHIHNIKKYFWINKKKQIIKIAKIILFSYNLQLQFQKFYKIFEKNTIRWVNVNTLINCIENRDCSTPLALRGVFYKTIQTCMSDLLSLRIKQSINK